MSIEILVAPHSREGELGEFDWEMRRKSFRCQWCDQTERDALAIWDRPGERHPLMDRHRICQRCARTLRDALNRAVEDGVLTE